MKSIDRLISEQVLTWAKREALAKKEHKKTKFWPVITISREFGARGKYLAHEIGRRTGFRVWDKDLISAIAEESGADERFLSSLDERRRSLIDDTLHGTLMGAKLSNTQYLRSLLRVVHTVGAHGKGIIVGRGGNYIIKSPDALRIKVVCPLEKRVAYITERDDISDKEALKLINSRDKDRRDFVQHYFKRDSDNASDYDLMLNSDSFTNDQMVEMVLKAYEMKVGEAIPIIEQ
jgi:cytidylate kinase